MGKAHADGDQEHRGGKKLVAGHDPEWIIRERLARRYGYRGPFDPQLIEDMAHPERRTMLIESMASIKDGQEKMSEILMQDLPEFWLRALDILGTKLLYARGYKTEGIYNIKEREQKQNLPLEQRKVKRTFVLPDGTIAKVV